MKLRAETIEKAFGDEPVLQGLELALEPGAVVSLIGLNGAGKTTLLRTLAGLLSPDRGRVLIDGVPLDRENLEQRRRFHFLPDTPVFLPGNTLLQHLVTVIELYRGDRRPKPERVRDVLDSLDLLRVARSLPGQLSRGQQFKACLAALVLISPEAWILDEPFASGMDAHGLSVLRRHMRAAADGGAIVLFSTQLIEIATSICDRVCILDAGRIVDDFGRADVGAMPSNGHGSLLHRLQRYRDGPDRSGPTP